MDDFALINIADLTVIRTVVGAQEFAGGTPPDVTHKGIKWVPLTDSPKPIVNNLIEIVSRNNEAVTLDGVARGWTVSKRPLADVIDDLSQVIDNQADRERIKHGSEGTSKQAEYDQIAAEAREHLIGNAMPGGFPLLQADVDAGLATDLTDAANKVLAAADGAKAKLAAIRFARRKKKADIAKAADVDAAWALSQGVVWPAK